MRALLPEKYRGFPIGKLPLKELAEVAERLGYIRSAAANFLIKSRNLIHPGVAVAESGGPSEGEAVAALKLTEDCVKKVAAAFTRT
jgi:hypothetical protein